MKTILHHLKAAISLALAARTASVAAPTAVDLAGFDGATIYVVTGTITDGSHALAVEESDNGTDWSVVAAADLAGSMPTLDTAAAHDNAVFEVGYIGTKRYIRTPVTVTGATTGGAYGTVIVRGLPRKLPA